jgi:hypothetical protein
MTEYALLIFAAVGLLLCLSDWRLGFLLCLVVGCLQDPIRKILPGEPIYVTSGIIIYFMATCLGAYFKGVRFNLRPIHAWNDTLRLPLNLFFLLVIIQSFVTLIRFGSPILAGIGLLAYITPVPGILIGYHFARREQEIHKFIKIYLLLNVLMISGIYFSYAGFDWTTLRSVGEGLVVYSPTTGEEIILRSGFYRAPEIAAWHAASSICFLIILFLSIAKHRSLKWATGVLILFFLGALLFTGRRKFIMEIFIFLCTYGGLLLLLRSKVSKTARASFLLMIGMGVAAMGYIFLVPDEFKAGIDPYYERGATVKVDATDRASLMTVESFNWVLEQNGPWGSGAGTGSQGAQYFGGGADIVGWAAEGGVAKVLAELGLPGIALMIWLALSLSRYFWMIIKDVRRADFARASLTYGLVSMLVANAFVFISAHQIFGDLFVLSLLGFLIGFVMAAPRLNAACTSPTASAALTPHRRIELAPAHSSGREA